MTVSESMSQKKSPAPTIEEVEDVDIQPRGNLPPKNPNHILEPSDEEMMPAPKKVTAGPSKKGQKRSPAPTIEEVEDVDIRPRGNLPPKNPNHILEASDEEMMPAPKEVTAGPSKIRRKKLKAKSTVVKSSDDEPEVTVTKKDKHNSLQNADGDIRKSGEIRYSNMSFMNLSQYYIT